MLLPEINRWTSVFNVLLDFMDRIEGGSEFHSLGPI